MPPTSSFLHSCYCLSKLVKVREMMLGCFFVLFKFDMEVNNVIKMLIQQRFPEHCLFRLEEEGDSVGPEGAKVWMGAGVTYPSFFPLCGT